MMNSTNKLSVIIPLYNAGDDFRTCMESLITQTWTALEIIIINDGSTDNSVEIAKHYAENYPHVRLLHQANAGASVARNRGIEVATGKYVAFVLMGEAFQRSPAFTVPESAQRWANQVRQENELSD